MAAFTVRGLLGSTVRGGDTVRGPLGVSIKPPPPLLPADGVGRARKRRHEDELLEVLLACGDLADHEYAVLVLT